MKQRYIEEALSTASMALLVLITLANVLVRYFTNESFAWTEEISVLLLVVMTLCGAASAMGRDQHIRVEFFYDSGSAERRKKLRVFSGVCAALLFGVLALLFVRVAMDEFKYAETTVALQMPRWLITALVVALCGLVTWRAGAFALCAAKEAP